MTAQKMKLEDWLDDLCVRFIINLPQADLASIARICFQVEEAHWFYDDFIRPLDRSLPPMTLRTFCLAIFKRCPLLAPFPIENHIRAFEEFLKYKISIPVRGAILLNEAMDRALLVKGWKKGANWSFPKGKINMNEDDLDCAIREVDEETGFDIRAAGLVPPPGDVKYIESTFRDQQIRLYVFRNVPMDTHFEPKTRKEIGGIQWYKIDDLPSYRKKAAPANGNPGQDTDDANPAASSNRFYMVAQFMGQLSKWIAQQRKKDAIRAGKEYLAPQPSLPEDAYTEDEGTALPEPVHTAPSDARDPNQILASATRDLRQMLHLPPQPSNNHQAMPEPGPAGLADPNQDRANALLAVLQKGSTGPPSLSSNPTAAPTGNPGMSLLHLLAQAPQPTDPPPPPQHQQHAPHPQQHQQQLPHYQQQQPPPFHQPMQPARPPLQAQPSPGYGQYEAPHGSPRQQQQQAYDKAQIALQNQHLLQRFQLQPQPQSQQQQQDPQAQVNPFAPNPQGPPPPPPPYTANGNSLQAQAHAQAQAAAAAFRTQQHPPPPIPLLHPQPLPPTVQKALFARDLLVSPDVAGHQNNMPVPPPPPPAAQYRGQQAPLSSHAAALLSAFKKDDARSRPNGGAPPTGAGAPAWPQQPSQQQHHVSQNGFPEPAAPTQQPPPFGALPDAHQLHGARPPPPPQQPYHTLPPGAFPPQHHPHGPRNPPSDAVSDSIREFLPTTMPAPANSAPRGPVPGRTVQHSEQHLSSLLGMFKQTAPSVQATAPAPMAAAAPDGAPVPPQHTTLAHNATLVQAADGPQGANQRTVYAATTVSAARGGQEHGQRQAIEAAARANGAPVEMNAELNLPFGALSLLTRPKDQDKTRPGHVNHMATRANASADLQPDRSQQHPSTFANPIAELPAGTTRLREHPSAAHQANQQFASGRQQLDSPGERRPSTRGSQPYSNPAAVRRPSYASSSSTAPVDSVPHAQGSAQQQQQLPPSNLPRPGAGGGMRPEHNPEHKQKLLSLFNKQPPLPPTGMAGAGMHPLLPHTPPHVQQAHHARPEPSTSRGSMDRAGMGHEGHGMAMDTLATAPAPADGPQTNTSRRGSQTPISPANRDFLLGYLASVSGTQ